MSEILSDPINLQIITVILAFVTIVVTIILYLLQRRYRHKSLSYEIISNAPLLSLKEEIKGNLQIVFNGKPVQSVHLIVVKIINSGKVPIVSTDYERPVSLNFSDNCQILTADISETNPKSLQASVSIENSKAVISPILLNSGDSIKVKLLVSQFDGQINVDGRVVGVKDISKLKDAEHIYTFFTIFGLILFFIGTIHIIRKMPTKISIEKFTQHQDFQYMILIFLGVFLTLIKDIRDFIRFWKK